LQRIAFEDSLTRLGEGGDDMARDIKKVDAKGRFFVPSKVKPLLGTEVVVTNSLDKGYLCVYTASDFEEIKEQLSNLNSVKQGVRVMKRVIIGEAVETNIDSQGRLTVTPELWDRIGANKGDEICVFDVGNKLEICTRAFYDNQELDLSALEIPEDCIVSGL